MSLYDAVPMAAYGVTAAAVIFGVALLAFLLNKGQKIRRWISAACMAACAVYLAWYFLPYRVLIDPADILTDTTMIREEDQGRPRVHLKPEGGEGLPLTGEEQRRLAELTNQLWFRRAILSYPESSTPEALDGKPPPPGAPEYLYLEVSTGHGNGIRVMCARGASGFWCYQGTYCLDSAYSRVYGWEPLVEYVRALADKYGVPQPTW